jgi:tetratricopeptide (TPR) repeat protein
MKKLLFFTIILFSGIAQLEAKTKNAIPNQVLTPSQKQKYRALKTQYFNYILSIPASKRSAEGTMQSSEDYLKKIGTPMALRLLDDLKSINKLSNEANALYTANKYNEAADKFSQAIAIDGEYSDLWEKRGSCYFDMHDYIQAINDYSVAINLSPGYGRTYFLRALSYQAIGDYTAARNNTLAAAYLGDSDAQKIVQAWDAAEKERMAAERAAFKEKIDKSIEERFGGGFSRSTK